MKKYTITDKEWESVLNKVQTLEKENQRLTGVIEVMEKAFSLYSVVKSLKSKKGVSIEQWLKNNKWEKIRHSTYMNEEKETKTTKKLTEDYISWIISL